MAKERRLKTLAPATVNKALSAIRVMLDHSVKELELISGNVAKTVTSLTVDEIEDPRLPFEPADIWTIFSAELPKNDGVSVRTLFWVLLLAPFTGCRLEELGKLRPGDIRRYDGIDHIAIKADRRRVREAQGGPAKRVKTSASKRDMLIHPVLIEAGFLDLVFKRREKNAEWLFRSSKPTSTAAARNVCRASSTTFWMQSGSPIPSWCFTLCDTPANARLGAKYLARSWICCSGTLTAR